MTQKYKNARSNEYAASADFCHIYVKQMNSLFLTDRHEVEGEQIGQISPVFGTNAGPLAGFSHAIGALNSRQTQLGLEHEI